MKDKNKEQQLLNNEKTRPNKALGQNFLINDGVCEKIAAATGANEGFGVIEIGPGLGALTKKLAARANKVVAVEIDSTIILKLRENIKSADNVEIINADILKTPLEELIKEKFSGLRVTVVGNLPYYITSPIIMSLLEERLPIESIVAMVQKEAAARLCAPSGSREGGAVTQAVRYYSEPKILFDVSRGSFYPIPNVTSSVIRLEVLKEPSVSPRNEKFMFSLIKAAFCMRRKTAVNSISAGLSLNKEAVAAAIEKAGLSLDIRPERITLSQFCQISDELC